MLQFPHILSKLITERSTKIYLPAPKTREFFTIEYICTYVRVIYFITFCTSRGNKLKQVLDIIEKDGDKIKVVHDT